MLRPGMPIALVSSQDISYRITSCFSVFILIYCNIQTLPFNSIRKIVNTTTSNMFKIELKIASQPGKNELSPMDTWVTPEKNWKPRWTYRNTERKLSNRMSKLPSSSLPQLHVEGLDRIFCNLNSAYQNTSKHKKAQYFLHQSGQFPLSLQQNRLYPG